MARCPHETLDVLCEARLIEWLDFFVSERGTGKGREAIPLAGVYRRLTLLYPRGLMNPGAFLLARVLGETVREV